MHIVSAVKHKSLTNKYLIMKTYIIKYEDYDGNVHTEKYNAFHHDNYHDILMNTCKIVYWIKDTEGKMYKP